jgi:DNA-binding transcriptional regulator YhcF (GntR family)
MEEDIALKGLPQRLASDIREGLETGRVRPSERLKSVRVLAASYGVSYVTMQRALKQLESEGVVEVRRGSGVYVRGQESQTAGAGSANRRIAAVLPAWLDTHGHDVVMRILLGFLKAGARNRWRIEVVYAPPSSHTSLDFLEEVLWRRPDGVAWFRPTPPQVLHLARLADRGMPVCSCGRQFPNAPFVGYSYDFGALARDVAGVALEHGKQSVCLVDVLDPFYTDPTPAQLFEPLQHAMGEAGFGEEAFWSVPLPRQDAEHSPGMGLEMLRDSRLGGVVVCPYQDQLACFAALAAEGFWGAHDRPILIDLNQHYVEEWPSALDDFAIFRAVYPFEAEGEAMARFFEWQWNGGPEPAEAPIRAVLKEMGTV